MAYLQRSAGFRIPRKATSILERTPDEKGNRSERDEIGAVPPREEQTRRQPWKQHKKLVLDVERPGKKTEYSYFSPDYLNVGLARWEVQTSTWWAETRCARTLLEQIRHCRSQLWPGIAEKQALNT